MGRNATTAARAVVEALTAEGVEYVFGLVGSHVLDIYDALADAPQIRHIAAKHENSAAFMAEAYGRLTGRPGVVLVTAGPGALNSISGVAQAYQNGTPMIHLSGTVPLTSGASEFHGTDQPDFLAKTFAEVTKWSVQVTRPQEIPDVLARAFQMAASGRPGPVHVEVPFDVLRMSAEAIPSYSRVEMVEPGVDAAAIKQLSSQLRRAQRPVICAGPDVLTRRVTAQLAALAQRLSAPIIVGGDALGAFPETHPLHAGAMIAYRLTPAMAGWIKASDCLLLVGMRAGSRDDKAIEAAVESPAIRVPCDSGTLEALAAELNGIAQGNHVGTVAALEEERRRLRAALQAVIEPHRRSRPIHFGVAMEALATQLDARAITVTGTGNHREWARWFLPVRESISQLPEGLWGTMGWELSGAIAAKLVHPERQVVAVTGDGSVLMAAGDLTTAVESGANILIVIMNDARYGMIEREQQCKYGRTIGVHLQPTDFAVWARACGASGLRVEQPEELEAAFHDALQQTRRTPVVVDIVCGAHYPCPDILGLSARRPSVLSRVTRRVQAVLAR